MNKSIDTMADKGRYAILSDAVMLIRSDIKFGPSVLNCWLPALTWVEDSGRSLHVIDGSLGIIDVGNFNTALYNAYA